MNIEIAFSVASALVWTRYYTSGHSVCISQMINVFIEFRLGIEVSNASLHCKTAILKHILMLNGHSSLPICLIDCGVELSSGAATSIPRVVIPVYVV